MTAGDPRRDMHAIQMQAVGSADVLRLVCLPRPAPAPGEVRVRLATSGVNFKDIYHRQGLYATPLPWIPGEEGAGIIDALGDGVAGWQIGDRVAWISSPGTYAEFATVSAQRLVAVPDHISLPHAAAALMQGMTAHYLSHDCVPLERGDWILVHAAAGGVGALLVQFAKRRGALVIGMVSTEAKADRVRVAGADVVLLYPQTDVRQVVHGLTKGRGMDVVYDSVGQATFSISLDCLRRRGTLVLFGQTSGPVTGFDPMDLGLRGSLQLTRPRIADYTCSRDDLMRHATAVFDGIAAGWLNLAIDRMFPLAEAAEAHRYLESRRSVGKVLLEVNLDSGQ